MRALVSREPGPPESLVVVDLPDPLPAPGEVAVRVEAAALNFFDTLVIEDRYQHRPERPFSPGGEVAGVVTALGAGVSGLRPGDRVVAYLGTGGCREVAICRAEAVTQVPEGISAEAAAVLPIAYGTALLALDHRGGLRPGEVLAVLGAGGGTGLAAVEIGRLLGARVIACASSASKLDAALRHGADLTLDTSSEPLKDGLRRLTEGRGVDLVYDTVGGALTEPALRALAWGGRHLVIGFAGGEIPRPPINLLLLKNADLRGVHFGEIARREPECLAAAMRRLLEWVAAGSLVPEIDAVVPLEAVPQALRRISGRGAVGKIVVRPGTAATGG
jgi:NADPH2:quinone reductase